MRALFVHDHRFTTHQGRIYSEGRLGDFYRYTRHFEDVTVFARAKGGNSDDIERMVELTNPAVHLESVDRLLDIFRPRELARIWRIVGDVECAIVRLPSVLGLTVRLIAWLRKRPTLIEMVGCPWDAYRFYGGLQKAVAPVMWALNRLAVRRASHVVYVTERFLQGRYPTTGKSVSISNVELGQVHDDVLKRRVDHINHEHRPLVVGTAAAVDVAYKGQQYVMEAIAVLAREGWDLEYQLVGGGKQDRLRQAAEALGVGSRVKFLGSQPHAKVLEWLETIDLYVQPSLQEGLPRALIEAMSRGLPACGSTSGGIPELLPQDAQFSPRKTGSAAATITAVLSDMEQRSIANLRTARRFSPNLLAARREGFFEEFIHDSS